MYNIIVYEFQSTLPARGATHLCGRQRRREQISIHAPRTGSDCARRRSSGEQDISIHAPRTGSDANRKEKRPGDWHFNPRSPHGERQVKYVPIPLDMAISIHAPRTGSDFLSSGRKSRRRIFQSTLPARGATSMFARLSTMPPIFQSTLPARGATASSAPPFPPISIHAPRTGSDCRPPVPVALQPVFQSTLPARGATTVGFVVQGPVHISIHAPRTGSDALGFRNHFAVCISIHAPRTGSDSASTGSFGRLTISIHAPRTGSDPTSSEIPASP